MIHKYEPMRKSLYYGVYLQEQNMSEFYFITGGYEN